MKDNTEKINALYKARSKVMIGSEEYKTIVDELRKLQKEEATRIKDLCHSAEQLNIDVDRLIDKANTLLKKI